MKLAVTFRIWLAVVGATLIFWTLTAGLAAEDGYWPYWRGPAADGMAIGDAPLHWSDTQNVRWKADIPGLGNSSPVVWGDQIYLRSKHRLYCIHEN
jgi:hypothetical protein